MQRNEHAGKPGLKDTLLQVGKLDTVDGRRILLDLTDRGPTATAIGDDWPAYAHGNSATLIEDGDVFRGIIHGPPGTTGGVSVEADAETVKSMVRQAAKGVV